MKSIIHLLFLGLLPAFAIAATTTFPAHIRCTGTIAPASFVVSALPSAATMGAGATAFVTDATATTARSIVAGGGSNKVEVFSDGINWLISGGTGAGSGDMLAANNLNDVASKPTARTNLGVAIGSDVQAWDQDLTDLADGTWTAASASQAFAQGAKYTYALTANLTASSFTGTTVNRPIKVLLTGCNGTASFTFPSAKRLGSTDAATTSLVPSAGNHLFVFNYIGTTWYYSDTVTGALNLAGGSSVVTGTLPVGNLPTVVTTAANSVTFLLTVDALANSQNYTISYVPAAFVITELRFVHNGTLSSPSIVPTIKHGTSRASGTSVVTSPAAVTNATTGASVTTFDSATTSANEWIWLETASKSGTTDKFTVAVVGHY